MCVCVRGSVVSAVCSDRFFIRLSMWGTWALKGAGVLLVILGGKIFAVFPLCFPFFFSFLQMDSLYSLVVWHATLLKTDHCALCSVSAFVPLFSRSVCTPILALLEEQKKGHLSLNLSMFPTKRRDPGVKTHRSLSPCQKVLEICQLISSKKSHTIPTLWSIVYFWNPTVILLPK